MVVDPLDVHLTPPRCRRSSRAARHASRTAPAAIQVMRDADDEPAEPTAAVPAGRERDVVGRELAARQLQDHVADPLAHLGRGAMQLGAPVRAQADARRGVVVVALGVAEVLEPDREADAPPDALAARRVAGAAGEADRVAWQPLGLRNGNRGGPADDLGDGQRAADALTGGKHVSWPERVQQAQLHTVDVERRGELVHLRLCREAGLDGAEAAHCTAGRIVRVDRPCPSMRTFSTR